MTAEKRKIIYTDKVRDGRLRMTEMELGTTISGTLVGLNPEGTKYGPSIQLTLKTGNTIELEPAGNVKRFFVSDVQNGDRKTGGFVSFTRKEDKVFGGRPTTQFATYQEGYTIPNRAASNAGSPAATPTAAESASLDAVKEALKG